MRDGDGVVVAYRRRILPQIHLSFTSVEYRCGVVGLVNLMLSRPKRHGHNSTCCYLYLHYPRRNALSCAIDVNTDFALEPTGAHTTCTTTSFVPVATNTLHYGKFGTKRETCSAKFGLVSGRRRWPYPLHVWPISGESVHRR